MDEKTITRQQLAFLLEVMAAVPRLIELVERMGGTSASSERSLGFRRLPDGRRVQVKIVAQAICPHGGTSTPGPAEPDAYRTRRS